MLIKSNFYHYILYFNYCFTLIYLSITTSKMFIRRTIIMITTLKKFKVIFKLLTFTVEITLLLLPTALNNTYLFIIAVVVRLASKKSFELLVLLPLSIVKSRFSFSNPIFSF